jgi:hypothetical protein
VTPVHFDAVALPTGTAGAGADQIVTDVHGWISAPPMRALVAAFDGALPDDLPTAELLDWLADFSATHWDFRGREAAKRATSAATAVERDQVTGVEFKPGTAELVLAAAEALGQVTAVPPARTSYDHVVVLGGMAAACLQRTEYAARLVRDGLETTTMAALGSFRLLSTVDEKDKPAELTVLGVPARYEFDAMETGIRRAFGVEQPVQRRSSEGAVDPRSWRVHTYRYEPGRRVDVLAAPAGAGAQRATTPDTYAFWAADVGVSAGDRVLVITTPLYVPFQHSDAVRILRDRGCTVETIGFAAAALDAAPGYVVPTPDKYLQEIRSGIRSMRDLVRALSTNS